APRKTDLQQPHETAGIRTNRNASSNRAEARFVRPDRVAQYKYSPLLFPGPGRRFDAWLDLGLAGSEQVARGKVLAADQLGDPIPGLRGIWPSHGEFGEVLANHGRVGR